jgi:hypothetical protein
MSEQQLIEPGTWVICEANSKVGLQRFTAQVQGQNVQEGVLYYRVQAEFPGGNPVFGVRRDQIVSVF